jgi:hypothetical protein
MNAGILLFFILCIGGIATLSVRLAAARRASEDEIDVNYYRVLARAIRRQRRVSVRLSNYMLDTGAQRYPPGFPLLLALFSPRALPRWGRMLNPLLDTLLGLGLGVFVWRLTYNPWAVAAAMAAHALTPALVDDCEGLNSRILGNLLFAATMLCYLQVLSDGATDTLAALCVAGAALLLTDKIGAQALLFMAVGLSLWRAQLEPLGLAALVFAAASVLSLGFYIKVLIGNIQVLDFWRRRHGLLYAHSVYRSPAYNDRPEIRRLAAREKAHSLPGIKGLLKNLVRLLDNNFLLPFFLYIVFTEYDWWTEIEHLMAAWVLLCYAMAAATLLVPPARFLGQGVKYIKLAAFPMAALTVGYLAADAPPIAWIVFLACIGLNARRSLKTAPPVPRGASPADDLAPVFEFLKDSPADGVLTLPGALAEKVVYACDKKVFWGAHGAGFARLEQFYPVLRTRVEDYFVRNNLSFLLIDSAYVNPDLLDLNHCFNCLLESGRYSLYKYFPH